MAAVRGLRNGHDRPQGQAIAPQGVIDGPGMGQEVAGLASRVPFAHIFIYLCILLGGKVPKTIKEIELHIRWDVSGRYGHKSLRVSSINFSFSS